MKVHRDIIGNIAYGRLAELIDQVNGLGDLNPDKQVIQEARWCLDVIDQLADGKKRLQFDIVHSK